MQRVKGGVLNGGTKAGWDSTKGCKAGDLFATLHTNQQEMVLRHKDNSDKQNRQGLIAKYIGKMRNSIVSTMI